jgi:hypothetical protein
MANNISEEMVLPLEDGEDLLPDATKIADDSKKEDNKILKKAEDAVEEINEPKGVDTPEEVELKVIQESLILREDLDDGEYFDLVHDLYHAMLPVCKKYARYTDANYEDFERAISEASERLIEDESDLWESLDEDVNNHNLKNDVYNSLSDVAYNYEVEKEVPVTKNDFKEATDYFIDKFFESVDESADTNDVLEEDFKLIKPLSDYQPWSGAIQTWSLIKDANKLDELDSLLEEVYPEGLDETELNDLLWFEPEWILESLGISDEDMYSNED